MVEPCFGAETESVVYDSAPDSVRSEMQFRLVYQGRLPAESSSPRTKDKHRLRQHFHRQLAQLWNEHPFLAKAKEIPPGRPGQLSTLDKLAADYTRCGIRFVPLVHKQWNLSCALDILFLRRDAPGGAIRNGGDIDNRLKVLFGGLRLPTDGSEITGPQQPGEDPFFCLVEDDALITEVSVTTDRLIIPLEAAEHVHDVLLVINVKTVQFDEGLFPVTRIWG